MMGESSLSLENVQGEVDPISPDGSGKPIEEEMDLLSHIIQRINDVYGVELSGEDKIDLDHVSQRIESNEELRQVMTGNNSEFDKRDFFINILRDEVSEYYGDRLDFYKKIMNLKVFPMIMEGLYKEYTRRLGA